MATPDVDSSEDRAEYLEERPPDLREDGSSNLPLRTKEIHPQAQRTARPAGMPVRDPVAVRDPVGVDPTSSLAGSGRRPGQARSPVVVHHTFVLKGGYTDSSPDGDDHLRAPAIRHRAATHQHTVVPDPGGCWTIIVTGPKVRNWGFWVKGKFVKMNKYFLTYGHHPCD